jgi:hypothetical protein
MFLASFPVLAPFMSISVHAGRCHSPDYSQPSFRRYAPQDTMVAAGGELHSQCGAMALAPLQPVESPRTQARVTEAEARTLILFTIAEECSTTTGSCFSASAWETLLER